MSGKATYPVFHRVTPCGLLTLEERQAKQEAIGGGINAKKNKASKVGIRVAPLR